MVAASGCLAKLVVVIIPRFLTVPDAGLRVPPVAPKPTEALERVAPWRVGGGGSHRSAAAAEVSVSAKYGFLDRVVPNCGFDCVAKRLAEDSTGDPSRDCAL